MGIFQNNLMGAAAAAASAGGDFYTHQIANSCRFDGSTSQLDRTPSSAGNRRTFTFSTWIKKVKNGVQQCFFSAGSGTYSDFEFDSSDRLSGHLVNGGTSFQSTALFRDLSAWYHFVVIMDTTQSTADDRCKVYINGERITAWNTDPASTISQNYDWDFNNNVKHAIGYEHTGRRYFAGYLADTYMVDGTAKAIGDCGTTKNGVWIPDDPSGFTFGTNGFHCKYESSSDLGNDSSGNNNDFNASAGLSAHDQMLDSPTFNSDSNGGNFCTLNPLFPDPTVARITNGNLAWGGSAGGGSVNEMGCMSTFAIPPSDTNIYYFEARMKVGPSGGVEQAIGVNVPTVDLTSDRGGRPTAWCISNNDNQRIYNGANSYTTTGVSGSAGDIVGVEIDRANTTIKFYVNGTLRGTQTNLNTTTDLYPWVGTGGSTSSGLGWDMNFGQNGSFNGLATAQGETDATGYGNFYYDEAGSCKALCAGNLPTADAVDPAQTDDYYPQKLFTALAYSGDGGGSQTTGFQPDWVWVKARNTSQGHGLWDSTRGVTKVLNSNLTNAEATSSGLTAFNTDGYTMGNFYNQSGNTYASWSWRANGGTTSSNSNGSITSTVQVDPSGCFSIVKYTGQSASRTVGHGLSTAPDFIIVKSIGAARNWAVYYGDTGKALQLNNTNAPDTGSYWNSTAPTSSVFSVADVSETGKSEDYIAYCFADTEGYIKSGSYVGNGSTDNVFVYTGFRPAFVMIKGIASGAGWNLHDIATSPHNLASTALQANSGNAELSNYNIDILSNGIKIRDSDGDLGTNGNTYVYLAIAKNPFKYATAR
jgi:hypothetical protein